MFEERGYRAVSVADITARAGTARGTFYLYFDNKEDVFAQVLAGSVDELYRTARAPQPDLAAAVLAYLRAFAAKPRLRRGTLEAALDSPEAARVWLEERRRFHHGLARHLRREQEAGVARPLDADVAAQALGSMVEWYGYTKLVFGEGPGDGELEAAARELAAIWHHAVHPD